MEGVFDEYELRKGLPHEKSVNDGFNRELSMGVLF